MSLQKREAWGGMLSGLKSLLYVAMARCAALSICAQQLLVMVTWRTDFQCFCASSALLLQPNVANPAALFMNDDQHLIWSTHVRISQEIRLCP